MDCLQSLKFSPATFAAHGVRFGKCGVRRIEFAVHQRSEQLLLVNARGHYFMLLD
jgi:hypothetical protein